MDEFQDPVVQILGSGFFSAQRWCRMSASMEVCVSSVPSPNLSHLSNETQALFQQLLVEAVEPVEAIREQRRLEQ